MTVYIATLAFAPPRIFLACIDQIYKTIGVDQNIVHVVLDQHYPIDAHRTGRLIHKICSEYDIYCYDLNENIGLGAGYNYLVKRLQESFGCQPSDTVILSDPDTYPITNGWGKALQMVASHEEVGWASLTFPVVDGEMEARGFEEKIINGHRVKFPKQTCMSSVCATRFEILNALGGIQEPKKYYGGAEGSTNPKLVAMGKRWAYLPDYREEASPLVQSEQIYKEYKWAYAHLNNTQLGFKEWLIENGHLAK